MKSTVTSPICLKSIRDLGVQEEQTIVVELIDQFGGGLFHGYLELLLRSVVGDGLGHGAWYLVGFWSDGPVFEP